MADDLPVPDLNPIEAIPAGPAAAGGAPKSTVPDAPQAPADLPASAKTPEPSPDKSSSEDDEEEEEKKQQDNPMDMLKPKKEGKKDEAQRAANDPMTLVNQLNDTVGEINKQVTDAFKGAAGGAKDAISDKIDQGIQQIRDFMEKDMPTMGEGKGAGPSTKMSAPDDTSPPEPAAAAQSEVSAGAVEMPKPAEAPTPEPGINADDAKDVGSDLSMQ